jgi:hypothetical protein
MRDDGEFDDVAAEKPKNSFFQKIGEFWNKMF